MKNQKKKTAGVTYLSSSESDPDYDDRPRKKSPRVSRVSETPQQQRTQSPRIRSSERIHTLRNRVFNKPSRKKLFSDIPSIKSPEKTFPSLHPKKLVNNFTRETHRYNYDPNYTSGESSIEDFIVDDQEVTSESQSSTSSSESESDEKKDTSGNDNHSRTSETNSEPQENGDEEAIKISGRKRTTSTPGNLLSDSDENSLDRTVAYALQDIEEILEKPFEANPEESTQTDEILPSVRKRNMNNTIASDTDEEGEDSGSFTSDEDESEESDSGDEHHSKRARLMARRRRKKMQRFDVLREARAKKTPCKSTNAAL